MDNNELKLYAHIMVEDLLLDEGLTAHLIAYLEPRFTDNRLELFKEEATQMMAEHRKGHND